MKTKLTRQPTTLQLAAMIADAVLRAARHADAGRRRDLTRDAPTQAVLDTLRATGHWFMREDVDGFGVGIAETAQRMGDV